MTYYTHFYIKFTGTDIQQFRYEIECAGNVAQGTYLVKCVELFQEGAVVVEQY